MRTNLKVFRVKHNLSQQEISEKIGCNRATYSCIETGIRSGRPDFWESLRKSFSVPEAEMYALMKNE